MKVTISPGNSLRASLANLLLARGHQRDAETELNRTLIPLNPIRADAETFERRRAALLADAAEQDGRPREIIDRLQLDAVDFQVMALGGVVGTPGAVLE